jgi:uncharacterized delta-60 repeat protein
MKAIRLIALGNVRALAFWTGVVAAGVWAPAASANPGDLDTTFDGDGIADTFSPVGVGGATVAVYPDARTLFGASIKDTASNRWIFFVARLTATGALDQTFGSTGSGKVLVDFPGYDAVLAGVAVQPDGKVVLAGTVCVPRDPFPIDCSFAAARLLPTGQYDPTFAPLLGGGKIVVPMGDSLAHAKDVVIDPLDGGILIAGGAPEPITQRRAFAVLRLAPSGWPDAGFGHGGKAWANVGTFGGEATSIALQSTGKIVLAGFAFAGAWGEHMALARLNRNGTLDTSFASGGTTVVIFARESSIGSSRVQAMTLQANDDIIVGGYGYIQGTSPLAYAGPLIRRLTKDGLLDVSFSGGATGMTLEFQDSSNNFIHDLTVQRDDKIVVTGVHNRDGPPQDPPQPQYIAYRLQPSGGLDSTFGTGGISVVTGGESFAVTVQRYGCIVLAGVKDYLTAPPAQRQGVLIRLVGDRQRRPWESPWERPCYSRIPDTFPPVILP